MMLSIVRITVILAYFAIAGALGGYIGATVGSSEALRVVLKDSPLAPAPRQWADI